MATQDTLAAQSAFTSALKLRVRQYLADGQLRQKDLAQRLGMTPAAISANLHPDMPMSEGFVRALSQGVGDFADAIHELMAIKNGTAPDSSTKSKIVARRARAERVARLRQAEKEVVAAVHALTALAIEAVGDE